MTARSGHTGPSWLLAAAIIAGGWALWPASAVAVSYETEAEHLFFLDMSTDTVLAEKAPDERMPTSSMGKMITVYEMFRRLDDGRLDLEDTTQVSEHAWQMGGSLMFLEVGDVVTMDELLQGIIVSSGNDAAVAAAEAMAGSEDIFARRATETAQELGMENTRFANASGWPNPDHYSTARDLTRLGVATIENFPSLYQNYYPQQTFTYNGISQDNRNPMLGRVPGADGLKTGHIEEAGYGLVGSAERDGRRLIFTFNGMPSSQARANEAERLIEWGFREFSVYTLFESDETVLEADTWLGAQETVPLVIEEPLEITLHRDVRADMEVRVRYRDPLPAPIEAGAEVATLVVDAPDIETIERPLVAGRAVDRLGVIGRIGAAVNYLLWGEAS